MAERNVLTDRNVRVLEETVRKVETLATQLARRMGRQDPVIYVVRPDDDVEMAEKVKCTIQKGSLVDAGPTERKLVGINVLGPRIKAATTCLAVSIAGMQSVEVGSTDGTENTNWALIAPANAAGDEGTFLICGQCQDLKIPEPINVKLEGSAFPAVLQDTHALSHDNAFGGPCAKAGVAKEDQSTVRYDFTLNLNLGTWLLKVAKVDIETGEQQWRIEWRGDETLFDVDGFADCDATFTAMEVVFNNSGINLGSTTVTINADTSEAAGTMPNIPSAPSPADGATGVSTTPTLSWTGNGTTYDVYFGLVDTLTLVSEGQAGTTYAPGTLSSSTTYEWFIVAKNSSGAASNDKWDFTTA